jgi:hypothetical protein
MICLRRDSIQRPQICDTLGDVKITRSATSKASWEALSTFILLNVQTASVSNKVRLNSGSIFELLMAKSCPNVNRNAAFLLVSLAANP